MRIQLDPTATQPLVNAVIEVVAALHEANMKLADIVDELQRRPTLAVNEVDPRLIRPPRENLGGSGAHPRP
jgi:hypothetical protein